MDDIRSGPTDEELHRWVDGRLDDERVAAVEAAMRADPGLAATLHAWRAQREGLVALGDAMRDDPVPPALLERAAGGGPTPPPTDGRRRPGAGSPQAWRIAAAASVAAAALGFVAGRASAPVPSLADGHAAAPRLAADAPGFVRAAAVAHAVYVPEVRHPVEVGADEATHLVAWLSKRLGARIAAPDLAGEGFELVGGRLLPGESAAVAQLMYQDARGGRITVYATRRDDAAPDTGFRFERVGEVRSFYWIDGGLGYVVSGAIDRDRLGRVATAVHRALADAPR